MRHDWLKIVGSTAFVTRQDDTNQTRDVRRKIEVVCECGLAFEHDTVAGALAAHERHQGAEYRRVHTPHLRIDTTSLRRGLWATAVYGCSCGWRPTDGRGDTDDQHAAHVAAANAADTTKEKPAP